MGILDNYYAPVSQQVIPKMHPDVNNRTQKLWDYLIFLYNYLPAKELQVFQNRWLSEDSVALLLEVEVYVEKMNNLIQYINYLEDFCGGKNSIFDIFRKNLDILEIEEFTGEIDNILKVDPAVDKKEMMAIYFRKKRKEKMDRLKLL